MRPAFMLLAMLLLFTPAWQALAQSAQYKYWRIRDTKDGPGCAIGVNDQTGAGRQADVRLVVAYDPQSRRFAFLIEGANWKFTPGETVDVTLRFDSASTLRLALLARKVDGRPAPLARFERDYSALLNELSIRRMVRIEHDGETIGTLNVGGGAEAVAAVLACQARHEGFASPSSPAPAPAQAPTPPRAAPAPPPALPSTRPPSSPPMREAPPPGETSPSTR